MATHAFTAAAWAPYPDLETIRLGAPDYVRAPEVEWVQRRDALSVAWLTERARAEEVRMVLRVHADAESYRRPENPFSALTRRGSIVTNRGLAADRTRRGSSGTVGGAPDYFARGHGATLAPWCDDRTARGAMGCANGSSILLHEHPDLPLHGGAMAVGALSLRTLRVTTDTRSTEQCDIVERLTSQLYNGWRSTPGSQAARHYLPELAASGMSWATFVGSLLASDPTHCDLAEAGRYAPPAWQEVQRQRRQLTCP